MIWKNITLTSLVIFTLFILTGCLGETAEPVDFVPESARVGTRLAVSGLDRPGDAVNEAVFFAGADDFVFPDSAVAGTLYVTVPFGSVSGDISFYLSGEWQTLHDLTVAETSPDSVKTVWSDLNYCINSAMATHTAMDVLVDYTWSCEIINDTLHLSAGFHPGDYSVYHHLFLRNRGAERLPEFLSGYSEYEPDYPGNIIYPLDSAIIKIQDWDTNNRISGRVFSTPWRFNNYTFFVELPEN